MVGELDSPPIMREIGLKTLLIYKILVVSKMNKK